MQCILKLSVHCLQAVLYLIFPMMLMGSACVRLRMRMLKPAAEHLRRAYTDRKAAVEMSDQQKKADAAAGKVGSAADNSTAVTLLGDLKGVYRFKDVTQLSVLCRAMRNWDEDGVPDPDAAEYGEFLLKVSLRWHDLLDAIVYCVPLTVVSCCCKHLMGVTHLVLQLVHGLDCQMHGLPRPKGCCHAA